MNGNLCVFLPLDASVWSVGPRFGRTKPEGTRVSTVSTQTTTQTMCCTTEPGGNKCEADVAGGEHNPASDCCPDVRTVMEALGRGDLTGAKVAFDQAGGMAACPCLADC
jgi:hypothetical protein